MFCGKCGAKNSDEALFCKMCGAPMNSVPKAANVSASVPFDSDRTNKKNRIIGIAVVAALAVIVLVGALALFGGREYQSTATQFVEASLHADAKALVKLIPDEVLDFALDELGYDRDDMKYALEEISEELESAIDELDSYLGDDWDISYQTLGAKDISGQDLRDLKKDYRNADMDLDISGAKKVTIKMTVKADDLESSNTVEIPVIKIGRSWYLDVINLDSLF